MLRTNSKKAKENIKDYIINNFNPVNYSPLFDHVNDFSGIASAIMETFEDEYLKHNIAYKSGRVSKQTMFVEWCSGLPSIIDTCYFYNRSAVDDLGMILEESEAEKARYTEPEAETMLTRLIYRELENACK